jgi:hypothetical protein
VKWPCMSTEKYPQHMPLLGEAMARGPVSGVKDRWAPHCPQLIFVQKEWFLLKNWETTESKIID